MIGSLILACVLSPFRHKTNSHLFQQPHFYYALVVSTPKAYAFRVRRHKSRIERVALRRHTDRITTVAAMVKKHVTTVAARPAPPKKISESVALTFTDPAKNPVNGANVQIEMYDGNNAVVFSKAYKTGEGKPGVVWVKAPKLPVVVKADLVSGEPWEIQNTEMGVVTLSGKEGDVVSSSSTSIERKLQASVTLSRPYTEISVKTQPQTSVFWGEDKVAEADSDGVADVKLPKTAANTDVSFLLQRSSGPYVFESEAVVDKVAPDSPNEVTAKPLALESVGDVQIQGYPDDSGGMVDGTEIASAYGRQRKKSKGSRNEKTGGTEWWDYPQQGLSFRMHKVRSEAGKEVELVERIRITSSEGGRVGSVQVGTSNEDLEKLMGPGVAEADGAAGYLDGGLLVHKGGSSVDWIEVCRPLALLKSGVMMGPTTGRSRILVKVGSGDDQFATMVRSKFSNVPGLEVVNRLEDADLVVKVDLDSFTHKQGNLLGAVPMLYSAECKLSYTITDTLTNAPAKGVDGNVVDTPPVDITAKADYEHDVEAGAILLSIAGVAAVQIRNPAERALILALLGGTAKVAVERMKDTMTRAIPRTNELAVAEAVDPILRSLEIATLFRARVSGVSGDDKTVTFNVGTANGVSQGMEFVIYNENVGAFPNSIDAERAEAGPHVVRSLKEDYVIARVTDAQSDHCACKLFQIKHSVSRKAYEQSSEKAFDEGISGILDPDTGLVNARIILRSAPSVPDSQGADHKS